jgi:hypothetical protein
MTQPQSAGSAGPAEVTKFHANSDLDSSTSAQHHSLGIGHNQSCAGDHTHNGKNSKRIGKGLDPTFPTVANAAYSQAQMQRVMDALVDLGFGS